MFRTRAISSVVVVLILVSQPTFQGCSHKNHDLRGKRVALAEIDASAESRSHVEVAIINEILDTGRFELVDRSSVQEALSVHPAASDRRRLGKKVGADYVMSIRLVEFKIDERRGYDSIKEEDSVLTEESGQDKPVLGVRYQKVRAYEGFVRLEVVFFDVTKNVVAYVAEGQATESLNSRDMKLPGKMQLLETLTRKAIAAALQKLK